MAIERKVDSKQTAVTKAAAPKKPKSDDSTALRSADRIRGQLAEARRKHAMEKLESPVTLRKLRKDLARALTLERAKADQKENT